jgi:gliding motility-associated-like protein
MMKVCNYLLVISCFFLSNFNSFAQTIGSPTHGLPSNPISVGYCSNQGTINYQTQFTFTGFPSNTQFVLELSNALGIFDSSTKQLAGPTVFSTSPAVFTFNIPNGTSGEGYRLRVRSIGTTSTPGVSDFGKPAYYMPFSSGFTINNNSSNLGICGNGSLTLQIDASKPGNPSPIDIPGIVYKWYKDDVVISGQTGPNYTTNTTGTYYVEINYGSCSTVSSITKSQKVNVTAINSDTNVTLVSSLDLSQEICPDTPTTLSTLPGYSYKWFKDGIVLEGITTNSYTTAVSGKYKVEVNFGACTTAKTSNEVEVKGIDFDLSIDAKVAPATNYIEEGQSLLVTATTDATSPTYEWFEPGNANSVSTSNSYTVTDPIDGEYKLIVTQNSGCVFPKEIKFKVKIGVESLKIPNLISPNDANGENDTWILPDEYKASNVEVLILDRYGKEVLRKTNYDDTWPSSPIEFKTINPVYYYVISKDGNPVKKGSITVIK